MTASNQLKGLLAGLATVAFVGTAFAQSTPPNPNSASAPMGAGQRSTQETPMGTTGTPAGGSAAATSGSSGTTGSSSSMGASGSTGSTSGSASMPSTSGSTSGSGSTMGAGSTDASASGSTGGRTARADRN